VHYSSGPHLLDEVGSGVAMCPVALDLTSRLRWALVLPHVLWLRTQPLDHGGSQCYHASRGHQWVMGLNYIKKGLAGLPMHLGSCVSKKRAHISKALDLRAIIALQDVLTCGYSATPALLTTHLAPLQYQVT
jgi:hypothetical protein